MRNIKIQYFSSPVGEMILGSFEDKLCLCDWKNRTKRDAIDTRIQKGLKASYLEEESDIVNRVIIQLNEYFNKQRTIFDIPLLLVGTNFQKQVWNALTQISYGTTESYLGLANKLNNPTAVRAVANANGANAISIIIPCHRIIGSNNNLVGYAGGLDAKKKLLNIEGLSV